MSPGKAFVTRTDPLTAEAKEQPSSCEPLWQAGAAQLRAMIADRTVSCREVTLSALARLDAVNPRLNAVVKPLHDEALAAADEADRRLRDGAAPGPLHGVPVTVKVNIDQKDHATDGGVKAYRHLVATNDNPVVANLRNAGAIIIGRTNTPCYSMRWFTDNDLHGRTLDRKSVV